MASISAVAVELIAHQIGEDGDGWRGGGSDCRQRGFIGLEHGGRAPGQCAEQAGGFDEGGQ